MIIYVNNRSPKKIKKQIKNRQAKKQAEYDLWLKSLEQYKPNFSNNKKVNTDNIIKHNKKYIRETPLYPSLETNGGVATKPVKGNVYTGDKMKGIGTLHKSNAVPVFSEEEAKDQANMRR
jgi:uncharacterized protein (UPF0305 family)